MANRRAKPENIEPSVSIDRLWLVSEGGWVASRRIIAVGRWDSMPIKRQARIAKEDNRCIDLTYGQACKYVIFLDSGYVVLSTQALQEMDE